MRSWPLSIPAPELGRLLQLYIYPGTFNIIQYVIQNVTVTETFIIAIIIITCIPTIDWWNCTLLLLLNWLSSNFLRLVCSHQTFLFFSMCSLSPSSDTIPLTLIRGISSLDFFYCDILSLNVTLIVHISSHT